MNPFSTKSRTSALLRSGRRTKKDIKRNAEKSVESPKPMTNGDNDEKTNVFDHVDVKQDHRDYRNCCITGMKFVTNGDLVLVDSSNYCLKVIDVKTMRIHSRFEVRYKPWDFYEFEPGSAVVTCPVNKMLLFISLASGNIYRQLLLGGVCYGVIVHKSELIVSFTYPTPEVQFLSQDGHILKTINILTTGQLLFKCPRYLTMSVDGSSFYVSDCGNNTVIKVSLIGGIEGIYDHRKVVNPRGVVTQGRSSFYVSGWGSNNISQVSSTCEHKDIVLTDGDGLHLPLCLAIRPTTKSPVTELYVSHDGSKRNTLSVYRL